jgi:large subunit ribosomal protein L31
MAKEGIHPAYHDVNVIMTDGTTFVTKTTKGKAGDTWRLDIDSKSHPAFTGGEQKLMQNDQVDKFSKKFGSFGAFGGSTKKKDDEKKSA